MKIIIQTPDFKATDDLLSFVEDNVGKLQSQHERIIESRVVLKLDNSNTQENKICEIRLVIPGNDLFASRQCKSFEEAVVKTMDALKHQADRWKSANGRR